MLAYWLLPFLAFWFGLKEKSSSSYSIVGRIRSSNLVWLVVGSLVFLLVGYRHEVGADWVTYAGQVERQLYAPFLNILAEKDPAYALLNWLGANWGGGVYLPNLVCAFLFTLGLVKFCRVLPRPWLALAVATPYLVTVVAMGYTRQSVAIGLAMLGIVALIQNKGVLRFVMWVVVAAAFHKSAVILVPLAFFSSRTNRFLVFFGVLATGSLLYFLLIQEQLDNLQYIYLERQYESAGAAVRVVMNLIPALIFLFFRSRFPLTESQNKFWTWMALGAVGLGFALILSPSSTAVDRVALFWIPMQLFVFAHAPEVFARFGIQRNFTVFILLAYSIAILATWLLISTHAALAWLPYQFYPFIWFSSEVL